MGVSGEETLLGCPAAEPVWIIRPWLRVTKFCVQGAYGRNCPGPCHTAESTTADNNAKKVIETVPRHIRIYRVPAVLEWPQNFKICIFYLLKKRVKQKPLARCALLHFAWKCHTGFFSSSRGGKLCTSTWHLALDRNARIEENSHTWLLLIICAIISVYRLY